MNLNVLVTEKCNLNCKHCLFNCPTQISLPLKTFKATIRKLKKYNLEHIGFSGGECIMEPDFEKMVEYVAKNNFTYDFTSNGLLYKKYLPIIKKTKKNLKVVRFSLDGTQKTHNYIRKEGSFEKVIEAIHFYKLLKIKVYVSFIANKKNLNELEDVIKLCKTMSVDKLDVGAILPTPQNKELWISFKEREKIYDSAKTLADKYEIKIQSSVSILSKRPLTFCSNLDLNLLTLTPRNEFNFCCNIPGSYSKIGTPDDDIETLFIRKKELGFKMFLKRLELIKNNKLKKDDNTCLFCYKYFKVPPFNR